MYDGNKIIYSKPKAQDLYYSAYAKGLIHRENCYSCQYAGTQRCSDITAGDFWGLDLSTLKNKTLKTAVCSVCLINTDKGETFSKTLQTLLNMKNAPFQSYFLTTSN